MNHWGRKELSKILGLLALSVLLLTLPTWAGTCTREVECEICGKVLVESYTCSDGDLVYYGDNMTFTYPGAWVQNSDERADDISISHSVTVCRECKLLYRDTIQDQTKKAWGAWLDKAKTERQQKRIENKQQARLNKLKDLERELDTIKGKIQKEKGE